MACSDIEDYIKVVYKKQDSNRYFYVHAYENLNCFNNYIGELLPNEDVDDLKKYWFDKNNDAVEIIDDDSWNIFKILSGPTKIVYLEDKIRNGGSTTKTSKQYDPTKAIHTGIICDGCEIQPIVGYRYKCVQCPDFDLCMKCEGKFMHPDHVMFRFPKRPEEIPFNKKFLKRMKKGCLINSESEDDEHHGHNRRRRGGHDHRYPNVFGHLYTTMHDMAETSDSPEDDAPRNQEKSKEKKRSRKHYKAPSNNGQTIDPNYFKHGARIFNNFSQMFAKMLDPFVIDIEVTEGNEKTTPNKDSNDSKEKKGQEGQEQTTETEKKNENESTKSVNDPEPSTSKQGDAITTPQQVIDVEMNDWTFVSPQGTDKAKQSELNHASTSASADSTNVNSASSSAHASAYGTDFISPPEHYSVGFSQSKTEQPQNYTKSYYAKLNDVLKKHLEQEQQNNTEANGATNAGITIPSNPTPPLQQQQQPGQQQQQQQQPGQQQQQQPSSPPPPPPQQQEQQQQQIQQQSSERRAQIVYHPKRHINDAIIGMMSMGFSNEGECLTRLLEQVDGDICHALEFLKPT